MSEIKLSSEQLNFINLAHKGNNILVDACIGSGKTTAIQHLCNSLPQKLHILYLTYNKLLKLDAQSKIKNKNVMVTNYHGFAASFCGTKAGMSMLIKEFNKRPPDFEPYDVLIIDEYQDIEQEFKEMLHVIKDKNPAMQIIAVGDMAQKIYDKTTLDVFGFIDEFLGQYTRLKFTKCFRICAEHAKMLGRVWKKKIVGVNEKCEIEMMLKDEVTSFLAGCNPQDILCLGANKGLRASVQNELEDMYPQRYNKKTVYSSISDEDSGNSKPSDGAAIFTTFDSSKGLERKFCVVFDFTESYWQMRIAKPNQSYDILRNLFCVAASRGKEKIIFVHDIKDLISEETLSTKVEINTDFKNISMSQMFDFKYREDIDECFELLERTKIDNRNSSFEIDINTSDDLVDLSPCIGIYQEAVFFHQYNIDKAVESTIKLNRDLKYLWTEYNQLTSFDEKILFLTSVETEQKRYRTQVNKPFVCETNKAKLHDRLAGIFSRNEEVQKNCAIHFEKGKGKAKGKDSFSALGLADVVKDNKVYELKFVSELSPEHFLQCACYVVALNLEVGILWNTRNNDMYEIRIPNKKLFLDAVIKTITKGVIKTYNEPNYHKPILDDSNIIFTSINEDTPRFRELRNRIVVLSDYKPLKSYLDSDKIFPLKDFVIWKEKNTFVSILISDTGLLLYSESNGIRQDLDNLTMLYKHPRKWKKPLDVKFVSKETKKGNKKHIMQLV